MSLILDALNKADRERQNNEAPPGIHTVHETREFKQEKPLWFFVLIGLAIFLLLALLAYFFLGSKSNTEIAPPQILETVETPKKSTSIPGLPKPVLVEKEKPSTTNKLAVNELYNRQVDQAEGRDIADATPTTQVKNPNPQLPTPVEQTNEPQEVAEIYKAPKALTETQAPVEVQASAPIPQAAIPQAAPAPRDRLSDYPEVSDISSLPWTLINTLPSLNYSSHIYANGGARKQIVINNQSKNEGQRLSENILIEKILKDGVILEFQGNKFKLRAMNSWVNI